MTIDDNVEFDWIELLPLVGLHKCYSNLKSKDKNYIGIGGMMQKQIKDDVKETIMNAEWGRSVKEKPSLFPLPIDAYVYVAYQAFVSTPIIISIIEKF